MSARSLLLDARQPTMLYRPNYCCHCGEKIDRPTWTPLTSRRFCEFCEIEQKQHDLLPRAVLVLAVLIGSAGLVSYFGRSGNTDSSVSRPLSQSRDVRSPKRNDDPAGNQAESAPVNQGRPLTANTKTFAANSEQRPTPQNSSTEAVYFCGAVTKKGTPCTRRVRTRSRCWQHAGQELPNAAR